MSIGYQDKQKGRSICHRVIRGRLCDNLFDLCFTASGTRNNQVSPCLLPQLSLTKISALSNYSSSHSLRVLGTGNHLLATYQRSDSHHLENSTCYIHLRLNPS